MQSWKRILIRSLGFGAGFAFVAGLLLATAVWWQQRPKSWSSKAVTAKIGELALTQRGEEVDMHFQYALANNTKDDYRLPEAPNGTLMRTLKASQSIAKVDDFTWPGVMVPSHQTVSATFEVVYRFSDYGTSAAEVYGSNNPQREVTSNLTKFVNQRLKDFPDGFVFLDERNKYRIELPSDWQGMVK
jgi:hypothetical protein